MKLSSRFAPAAALAFTLFSSSASAVVIDFIKLTEGGHVNPVLAPLGESAWSTLSIPQAFGMQITGHAAEGAGTGMDNDPNQFAYLDNGNAGLGVCKDLNDATVVNTAFPGSGTNRCAPGSDDNVTFTEYLEFSFTQDVVVDNLWFNNNHDGGFGAGDEVTIDGIDYAVSTGYAGGANGIGSFSLLSGEILKVAFKNEQFYVSAIEVSAVPVPAAVWLFGTAMLGLFGFNKRRSAVAA